MSQAEIQTRKGASLRGTLSGQSLGLILGILPLVSFMGVFFFWPLWSVLWSSFQDNVGAFTLANFQLALGEPYKTAFSNSISLGLISAISSAIPGAMIAYVIESRGGERLRQFVASISGVLSTTGGVPLAFMFIAAYGAEGSATAVLRAFGINIYAGTFTLYSLAGVIFVYSYFMIPTMVIVFSPAVHGIRKEWQEAAKNLGATTAQFWRRVGIPLLFPSFISSLLLLFAAAFSAYATARAMTSGSVALVPLMIGNLVDGNVINDQMNLGKALAMGMVLVSLVAMIPYLLIQRRASRWQ